MTYVGLRHDVDTIIGLKKGVPKVVEIEESFGVKSTFFIRPVLLIDNDSISMLKRIEERGWEIGLHLDSTAGAHAIEKARKELYLLRSKGFNVEGATPHGGLIGFREETWRVLDSLGLKYIQGYGTHPSWVKSKILPNPMTLDILVKKRGVVKGLDEFINILTKRLEERKIAIVNTHPEYFVISVGSSLFSRTDVSRKHSLNARVYKLIDNVLKIMYSLANYKLIDKAYEILLENLREKNIIMCRLRDLADLI